MPKRRRAFRLTPARHYARQHFVVLDVTWRIDEALKVVGVIVGLLNVGARVRHNSLTRTPERQQEKVHPRRFRPTQQMDRAIVRVGLIIAKAEVNQIAQVGLGLLDGTTPLQTRAIVLSSPSLRPRFGQNGSGELSEYTS